MFISCIWKSLSLNAINQIILNSNDKKIRSLLIVPCLCHKVHNSLTSAVRKNEELSALIHQVHNISKICNEDIDEIGKKCPTHVNTRWIYDFDIVDYIIKYNDIISTKCEIPGSIEQLQEYLKILKVLVKKFKDPKNMIGIAYP